METTAAAAVPIILPVKEVTLQEKKTKGRTIVDKLAHARRNRFLEEEKRNLRKSTCDFLKQFRTSVAFFWRLEAKSNKQIQSNNVNFYSPESICPPWQHNQS